MLGKNPRAGFSYLILDSSFLNRGAGPRLRRGAARGGDILFAEATIREGYSWGWKHEKNQPRIGANPPFGRSESDLLILTLAIQLRCLARPFIGSVRANPVGAPAPPVWRMGICLSSFFGVRGSDCGLDAESGRT
ncbi:hypothetical protein SDC9_23734 [bioreactor metagenome]|uniref:Uncharacterized protein n=1 Tax=bioreactor metagenome TaxID=1076179 RepID=A0A644UG03_9ZZZZ